MPGPNPFSGTYTYASLQYNTVKFDTLSSSNKTFMATHEFGHILGLAHNCLFSIMNTECFWYDMITSHDTTDLYDLYLFLYQQ